MMEFLVASAVMGGMGVLLAALLAIADKKLYVWEDPRIAQVEALLPHANCGGCGFPGCRMFAEKCVEGVIAPGKCNVNTADGILAIATLLQVDAGQEEKRVARLACAGGSNVSRHRARYEGIESCRAAALISGGDKSCSWGCIGLGDCMRVCTFNAIRMDAHGLPVVDEAKCTACGDCVAMCPKNLFSLHPVSHRLWVACLNKLNGDLAEAECEVACTACGRCAADAPGLIRIENNLAVVDYSRNSKATPAPIQRCPTGAIIWIDEKRGPVKGLEAKRITRKSALPIEESSLPVAVKH